MASNGTNFLSLLETSTDVVLWTKTVKKKCRKYDKSKWEQEIKKTRNRNLHVQIYCTELSNIFHRYKFE